MGLPQAILLLGATGSGKTPRGAMIARRGGWGRRCRHFDFGDHLRQVAAQGRWPGLSAADIAVVTAAVGSGALLEDEHFHIAATILRGFIAAGTPVDLIVLMTRQMANSINIMMDSRRVRYGAAGLAPGA